tara:strand:+ start:259 stop:651 length:393 start_codon:yes stop_codon:yes gene_type:complete
MSNNENLDPARIWREWFVKSEKAFSDAMTEMMGDEHFSEGLGRYMNEALHTHRMFSESMGQYLANLNIPSRGDILDMSDRLAHIENTLGQIQVELRQQRTQLSKLASAAGESNDAPKKPARTRKPTKSAS